MMREYARAWTEAPSIVLGDLVQRLEVTASSEGQVLTHYASYCPTLLNRRNSSEAIFR